MTALAVTDETERLIDHLSAIQRFGGAGTRAHEAIRGFPRHRHLAAGGWHCASDRRNRPGIWLDVALMAHGREPADLVDHGVRIAGGEQDEPAAKQQAFTHAATLQLQPRAAASPRARLYPIQPARTRRSDRW